MMGASPRTNQRQRVDRSRRVVSAGASGTVTDRFELVISGEPHGQGRARSGQGRVYTPAATRAHAQRVQTEWIAAGRPTLPVDAWYRLWVTSFRARPTSHYLSDGVSLSAVGRRVEWPGKPDVDNEIKAIADALVACGAIPDDRLCVKACADKRWMPSHGLQCVTVLVEAVS